MRDLYIDLYKGSECEDYDSWRIREENNKCNFGLIITVATAGKDDCERIDIMVSDYMG
jgi:hypothetical protein